jgi:hypothetical protein
MSNPKPEGLEPSGERLWNEITSKYKLRTDEYRVLEDACREADLIDLMQRGLKDAPLFMKGSMGQQVANPLFSELRQHRATLASLLGKLQLPDLDSGAKPRSVGARKAAAARWGSTGA